jgi:hypothetical protein
MLPAVMILCALLFAGSVLVTVLALIRERGEEPRFTGTRNSFSFARLRRIAMRCNETRYFARLPVLRGLSLQACRGSASARMRATASF